LEISFSSNLGRPSDLIVCRSSEMNWSGMVSVTAYGQSLRDKWDLSSADGIGCLTDILPYAIHQCLTLLHPIKDTTRRRLNTSFSQSTSSDSNDFAFDKNLLPLSSNPFGQDTNISKAMSLMLGLSLDGPPIGVKPLADDVQFHDLPALQSYLAALKTTRECARCNQTTSRRFRRCLRENFWRGLACLVTDILCLSFFENLHELSISLHGDRRTRIEVGSGVYDVLTRGGHQAYSVAEFYDWALALVGYSRRAQVKKPRRAFRRRILSSVKGQVIYLKLFETCQVTRRGYMTFAWARGVLRFGDVEYSGAVEPAQSFYGLRTKTTNFLGEVVISPRNLCWGDSMVWTITDRKGPDESLEVTAVYRRMIGRRDIPVNPFHIVENLAQSLMMEGCEHNSDTPLNRPDMEAMYTGPLFSHSCLDHNDHTSITCAAVAGDNGLRLLTFGSQGPPFPMVFRGGACLACALDVCRKANSRLLIL
jgi:hypothetical protein